MSLESFFKDTDTILLHEGGDDEGGKKKRPGKPLKDKIKGKIKEWGDAVGEALDDLLPRPEPEPIPIPVRPRPGGPPRRR